MNKMVIIGLLLIVFFVEIPFYEFQKYRYYVQVTEDRTITHWTSYRNLYGAATIWSKLIWFKITHRISAIYVGSGKELMKIGKITDVKFWDRVLSADEMENLHKNREIK